MYRCAYLRGTATGFASPCTPVYVSEHPLSCSFRVLSRVLCCLQYAPVHYAALVPLSCIPRFLFTNYHAALLLSSFPGMALSTHLSVSSSVSLCSCLQIYLGTYLYRPVCMGLCVDVSAAVSLPGCLCTLTSTFTRPALYLSVYIPD